MTEPPPSSPLDATHTCLVTGAAGYLGQHLVHALRARGCTVRAFDIAPDPTTATPEEGDPRIDWHCGDIRNRDALGEVMEGVDVVFHAAAVIELARRAPADVVRRVREINVEGTRAVVELATALGVRRLIHTSSTNACFGEDTAGGDETGPYTRSRDLYSSTKADAERIVLAADRPGHLRTCALRPGGIYGPGERRTMLGPLLGSLAKGQPVVVFGNGRSRLDYTYIDNIVDAQLRAADRLVDDSPVPGQAYFVTDGSPINPGEFSIRLVRAMGIERRVIRVPRRVAATLATLGELAYGTFGRPKPQVCEVTVTLCTLDNWFRIDKARRDLGYAPLLDTDEGIRRTAVEALEHYRSLTENRA